MNFSTLNESDLHKTIKIIYAEEYNGTTEVELHNHIFDVFTDDKTVIEIQTKNLSKLFKKISDCLEKGLKVILVHPLIEKKTIETYKDGILISKRKSPKKGNIYSLFKEITGIYPILLHPNFKMEVLLVDTIEQREKLNENVQSKNNRRRFKKDWIKINKKLETINEKIVFNSADDYLNLLPQNLPDSFSAKELKQCLTNNNHIPSSAAQYAHLIIWVLFRMNLIEFVYKEKRSNYYKKRQS